MQLNLVIFFKEISMKVKSKVNVGPFLIIRRSI